MNLYFRALMIGTPASGGVVENISTSAIERLTCLYADCVVRRHVVLCRACSVASCTLIAASSRHRQLPLRSR